MRVFKLFLDPFEERERWLNEKAREGYRLVDIGGLSTLYTFEPSDTVYSYGVQYIGHMSNRERLDYESYLLDAGYRFWNVAINLGQVSIGRVKWRPHSEGSGQIATSSGMINREILVIESKGIGDPLKVFTTIDSQIEDLQRRRRAHWLLLVFAGGFAAWKWIPMPFKGFQWTIWSYEPKIATPLAAVLLTLLGLYALWCILMYSGRIRRLKEEKRIRE